MQETRNKLTDYWKESGVKKGIELPAISKHFREFIFNKS